MPVLTTNKGFWKSQCRRGLRSTRLIMQIKKHAGIIFILLAVFFAFSPSLQNNFTNWDDESHLLDNPAVLSLAPNNFIQIFTQMVNNTYIPLTTLSFAVEYHFFKFNPFVYHLDNLILHLWITFLVFGLAQRLGLNLYAALAAALLFGIHPMHVESVAWVTERKDVLYGLFYLLAINSYLDYKKNNQRKIYFLSIFFCLLSILAKPMALSLPLILLLCDWFGQRQFTKSLFIEKIPYVLIVVPVALITFILNTHASERSFVEGVMIWFWSLTFYIQKFIFPYPLVPLYSLPKPVVFSNWPYLLSALTVVITTSTAIFSRKNRWVIFAFGFYFFSIFFLLRFDESKDISLVADRFMYLPSIGYCLLWGWGLGKIDLSFPRKRESLTRVFRSPIEAFGDGKKLLQFGFIGLYLFLGFQTFNQCKVWKDGLTLWSVVIEHFQDIPLAYYNRGKAYEYEKQPKEALIDYTQAIKLRPDYAEAYTNRGGIYQEEHRYELAQADLNKALSINPNFDKALNNRGIIYNNIRSYDLAIVDFTKAIAINPSFDRAYNNRGLSLFYLKSYERALLDFNQAILLNPTYADAYFNRANLHKTMGNNSLSLDDYAKTLAFNPQNLKAYLNRANLYGAMGEYDLAIADYNTLLKFDPNSGEGHNNRGVVYQAKGEYQLALADFKRSLAINPRFSPAYANLGNIYTETEDFDQAIESYTKALAIENESATLYYRRAIAFIGQKDYTKALEDALKAKSLGYPDMDIFVVKLEKMMVGVGKDSLPKTSP